MGSENVGLIIMKTDGGGGEDSPTYRKSDRTGKISRGSSLQLTGGTLSGAVRQEERSHFRPDWINQIFTTSRQA